MNAVVVCPYSDEWPELFQLIKAELLDVFATTEVCVEHIGSTAVPGLVAKPVIDVLIGAESLIAIESKIGLLHERGFEYVSKYETQIPERRYFVKAPINSLRVHVHAVELGARLWREHLAFRDALRGDATLKAQYQALKLQLANTFAADKSAYGFAKNPFVESVIATSLKRIDVQCKNAC